jgi:hypothetical protein
MAAAEHVDFFISYTGADEPWAEWVGDTLETSGYRVIVQKWDFPAGSNFVLRMHEAAERADRTILILSPASLSSGFAAPEWAAAFVSDPKGSKAKLLPVRVAECRPTGLLKSIVYIDLVGLDEAAAAAKLLAELGSVRRKPATKVQFPGAPAQSNESHAASSSVTGTGWQKLPGQVDVTWHTVTRHSYVSTFGSQLEIELIPIPEVEVEVRRLATVPDDLMAIGRASGLFDASLAVSREHSGDVAKAEAQDQRRSHVAGMLVTRNGQRGAWFSLPSDSMGAVFDAADLTRQLTSVLSTLFGLPVPQASGYAFGLALVSPIMLTFNPISVLGTRTGSTSIRMSSEDIVVEPTNYLSTAHIRDHPADVAEELVARLEAAIRG